MACLGALELAFHHAQRLACREDGLSRLRVVLASAVQAGDTALRRELHIPHCQTWLQLAAVVMGAGGRGGEGQRGVGGGRGQVLTAPRRRKERLDVSGPERQAQSTGSEPGGA